MKNNNRNKKHILSLLLLLILIGVTFFLIFKKTSIASVRLALSHINPIYVVMGIACMFIYVSCEGECLRIICNSLGEKISFLKSFVYACSDVYFSAITPSATGGQPAMIYYMSKDNIPLSRSSLSVLLTLIEYMAVLVILGILSFFFHFSFIMHSTLFIIMFCFGLVMSALVIVGSLAAMFSKTLIQRFGRWCIRVLAKIRIIKDTENANASLDKQLAEYKKGAEYIKTHPIISIRVFIISFIQRTSLLTVTYLVYRGLGLNDTSMISVLAMQSVVMLSVTSLPLPGAVGASEFMFTQAFGNFFPRDLVMPAMLLTRGINFYFNTLFAGAVSMCNHISLMRKRRKNNSSKNNAR